MSLISRNRIWSYFQCLYENQLTKESVQAEQPTWIKTPLFPHQKTSLAAAIALEQSKEKGLEVGRLPGEDHGGCLFTNYGILGDRVGSGKSLIALSLVKQTSPSSQYTEYVIRSSGDTTVGLLRQREMTTGHYGQTLRHIDTALFIIPHALINQWEEYIKNDTTLKALFLKKRKDTIEDTIFQKIPDYDVVFISSTMWKEFEYTHPIHTYVWSRCFFDEADTLSTTINNERLNARFFWLISASWMNLVFSNGLDLNIVSSHIPLESTPEHTVEYIRKYQQGPYISIQGTRNTFIRNLCGSCSISPFNISSLNAAFFQSTRILIHNKEEFIRDSFNIPEIKHIRILCSTPANIRVLNDMISDEMMERLHAGDSEGVLDMLGMSTRTAEEITNAVSDTIQKEIDQARHLYEFKKSIEYSSELAKRKALEQIEEKIARLTSRVEAIASRINNTMEQMCPICLCEVSTPTLTPCCRNLFCFGCICESLKKSVVCPLCRQGIHDIQTLQVIGDKRTMEAAKEELQKIMTKHETFRNFLRENPSSRILMFSGYDATFHGLSELLTSDGIPHATLHGTNAHITKLIRQFSEGKYRVLFLNAKHMGAGLNIQSASHVVLYHRMPIETQNQIIGRAMRMGRTEDLTVVHLLHANEMDNHQGQRIEHL